MCLVYSLPCGGTFVQHGTFILLPSASAHDLLRLCPSSSQHPPSLALLTNLFLPSNRPVSSLFTDESNTYLQCTKVVPQYLEAPRFGSQHPQNSSQLSETPAPEDLVPSWFWPPWTLQILVAQILIVLNNKNPESDIGV